VGVVLVALLLAACTKSPNGGTGATIPPLPMTEVPNVKGLEVGDAKVQLKDADLTFEVTKRYSAAVPRAVLNQRPRPGGRVVQRSLIRLTIAKPFPRIPRVVGMTVSEARRLLRRAGFTWRVLPQYANQPKHEVISQSPAGGTESRPGRRVDLFVSKGLPGANGPLYVTGLTVTPAGGHPIRSFDACVGRWRDVCSDRGEWLAGDHPRVEGLVEPHHKYMRAELWRRAPHGTWEPIAWVAIRDSGRMTWQWDTTTDDIRKRPWRFRYRIPGHERTSDIVRITVLPSDD